VQEPVKLGFGLRCSEGLIDTLLRDTTSARFAYEEGCGFYETGVLYAVNRFIEQGEGEMIFIAAFGEAFRVTRVCCL